MEKRKMTAGFTLVELIVVIAILGILAGVGTVGYSGYIKKANMAADEQLVSGVKNALQLAYYGDMPNQNSGYVLLSASGADDGAAEGEEGGFVDEAMTAAFGEDWRETCALKYNGWTDNGLLSLVAEYSPEEAQKIANSTYLTTATTDGMMSAVTNVLNIAADAISGSDLSKAEERLNLLDPGLVVKLNDIGLDTEDPEYGTAVANLLVGHFAGALSASAGNSDDTKRVADMVTYYGALYAYCEIEQDYTLIDTLNSKLASIEYDELSKDKCITILEQEVGAKYEDFIDYADANVETYEADADALLEMMRAVKSVSGTYADKDSLTNATLYSSTEVADQINGYANAIRARANGAELPSALADGSVAIMLYADGTTYSTVNFDA